MQPSFHMSTPLDFGALFDLSPNPYMVLDRELRYVTANQAYLRETASRLEDILGRYIFEAFPNDPADPNNASAVMLRESFQRVLKTGVTDTVALIPYRIPRHTEHGIVEEERFWSATHTPLRNERAEVEFILQHTVDVTELQRLKQAAAAGGVASPEEQLEAGVFRRAQRVQEENRTLDAERRHLRRLFEQAPGFVCFLRGRDHVVELANSAYYQVVGHRPIIGKPIREALPEVAGQGFFELLDGVFRTGEAFVGRGMHAHVQRHPGAPRDELFLDLVYQPIIELDGSISGIFVQGHDVTAQYHAQNELKRYREHLEELVRERTRELEESEAKRRQAQAALQQAQKMDAVGKLTGGVAHDFNNLLQVIGGNLQLVQKELAADEQSQRRLQSSLAAVSRGAKLASQMLAFARRQPLDPVVVNMGRLVSGMDDLLRRALGERIELETAVAEGLWNSFADPTQIENVLLNLAINARDAMNGEGRLRVEVGNAVLDQPYTQLHPDVAPGQYVQLSVSDTGSGMSPEVLERVFEPFFTTKPEGRGTGLGLSMVYGFVKQSGGHIRIESEVGRGTTVRIFLPQATQAEALLPEVVKSQIEGGAETILVVEDDAEVRATTVAMLSELGYRVLNAADGQSALTLLQTGEPVDLLFSDVVMPGPLRGPDLARQAKALFPELEVLFASGYTDNAIMQDGRLEPGVCLLSKPYGREELARKVRQVLRSREERSVAPPLDVSSLRILFVEDDLEIQETGVELLTDLGHRVEAAASAEEATKLLAGQPFDLLLTDAGLPGMSGVALAKQVAEQHPKMQIIVASGFGREALKGGGADIEAITLLPKPYDVTQLERALSRVRQV